jgi:transposase InsO family protein
MGPFSPNSMHSLRTCLMLTVQLRRTSRAWTNRYPECGCRLNLNRLRAKIAPLPQLSIIFSWVPRWFPTMEKLPFLLDQFWRSSPSPGARSAEHWHVDITYINVRGTFFFLCGLLNGCSRSIVHWRSGRKWKKATSRQSSSEHGIPLRMSLPGSSVTTVLVRRAGLQGSHSHILYKIYTNILLLSPRRRKDRAMAFSINSPY